MTPQGVALKQLEADVGLEVSNRLRERGLGDVQPLRGAGDLPLFRNRYEVA